MKHIQHIFNPDKKELENWQKIIGGTITGNTLKTNEGTIKEYSFNSHNIILVKFNLNEEIVSSRIMSKLTQDAYYPIIFSDCVTFEPKNNKTVKAKSTSSLSTSIYFSNDNISIEYPANKEVKLVLFRISQKKLKELLSTEHSFFSHIKRENTFHFYEAINVEMKICIQKLFNTNRPASIEEEFVKTYSWELFLLFIEKFFYIRKNHYFKISYEQQQTLHNVKEYMLSDLSKPKKIEELVKHSGMSATKLRCLFKEVYGVSIYTMFLEHRMEKARKLLCQGEKNVSEIAYELGYTHLGHFTEAFKKRYHCLPKNFQKEAERREKSVVFG